MNHIAHPAATDAAQLAKIVNPTLSKWFGITLEGRMRVDVHEVTEGQDQADNALVLDLKVIDLGLTFPIIFGGREIHGNTYLAVASSEIANSPFMVAIGDHLTEGDDVPCLDVDQAGKEFMFGMAGIFNSYRHKSLRLARITG